MLDAEYYIRAIDVLQQSVVIDINAVTPTL
jgi:hypothetical protein